MTDARVSPPGEAMRDALHGLRARRLRLELSRRTALVGLVAGAGVALRIWTLRSGIGVPDSDEEIVGLMARHALHGELRVFYWGQPYGGTQEMLLTVPLFAVFGASVAAVRIVPIALVAVGSLLVWRVGRRTIGESAGAVAGGLFWLWPPYMVYHASVHQYGFYASDVVYCTLLLLLALRVVERPDRFRVGCLGLVLGLAFWQTAQIIPVALPIIAWTVWKKPAALRQLWTAVPLAALGALPWLVWNVEHHWGSLLRRSGPGAYAHGLRLFVSPLLPMLLGLRAPWSAQLIVPKILAYAAYAALLALFAYGAVRTRKRPVSLLYAVAAVFPLIWPVSHRVTLLTSHPVFLVVLSPVLALLLAQAAGTYRRGVAVLVLGALVSAVSLHRMDVWHATHRHWPPTIPRSFTPLISTLDRLRLDHVYADYWIAYRLDFETHERIVAVENPFVSVRFVGGRAVPAYFPLARYQPYQRRVRAATRTGFVLFRQYAVTTPIVPALVQHGYRRHFVGPFVVFSPPTA